MKNYNLSIKGEEFILCPEKAVFWKRKRTLIVADLHFGKAGHFRKAGIYIPRASFENDLSRLDQLLIYFAPTRVFFLGDLFHSLENNECEEVGAFFREKRKELGIEFLLVPGNHDIFEKERYQDFSLELTDLDHREDGFRFVHEPMNPVENWFLFCGHIHPGLFISGSRVPCFWFSEQQLVLPPFGSFTGTVRPKIQKHDKMFGIVDKTVLEL